MGVDQTSPGNERIDGRALDVTVSVRDLHVRYHVYSENQLSLGQLSARRFQRRKSTEVHAIKGVSFDVHRGEALGIIGSNGSGKSTLLRTVAGLQAPSGGQALVSSQPRMLAVGASLRPKLTGYRNIYLGSLAMGLRMHDVEELIDEIVEWTELGDAINRPMQTYSSGMRARLAFAIATIRAPEIMLIDEALAVGDKEFRAKSLERLRNLQRAAGTLLMVTHNLAEIRSTCSRAVWLDKGVIRAEGAAGEIIDLYRSDSDEP
jgi:teichoic acid transport system ATP-binding protein